jgi:hypothetical protein
MPVSLYAVPNRATTQYNWRVFSRRGCRLNDRPYHEPTADPVFPELTENPAPWEVMVPPVLKAWMANQAPRELLVDAALTEQRARKARPALRGLKVAPQAAKVNREPAQWGSAFHEAAGAPGMTGTFYKTPDTGPGRPIRTRPDSPRSCMSKNKPNPERGAPIRTPLASHHRR